MKVCPNCFAEYENTPETCNDCGRALVTEEEFANRPEFRRIRDDDDTTRFVRVGTADDPFEADAFSAAIHEVGIPVLTVMKRGSSVDALTTGLQRSWWELRVPSEKLTEAAEALEARRRVMAETAAEAEQAAVEESMQPPEEQPA